MGVIILYKISIPYKTMSVKVDCDLGLGGGYRLTPLWQKRLAISDSVFLGPKYPLSEHVISR